MSELAGLSETDLRTDIYRSGISCPVAVRVTHLPTGLVASAEDRSTIRARTQALDELQRKVSVRQKCICGSVAAQQNGRSSWLRLDILCPVCDIRPPGLDLPHGPSDDLTTLRFHGLWPVA